MSQTGQQIITIYILPNILSKGNQIMKFGQLIDYNIKSTFLEKSYTECDRESNTRPFYKKSKLTISLDQQSEMLQNLFLLKSKSRSKKSLPLAFTLYKAFLKNKEIWNQSPYLIFCIIFKGIFLALYFINWPNFIA